MADSSPLYTETPMEEHTERHVLYERMAEQYIQLLNPGKALDNALDAIKWKRDSYKAHWLMGSSFMSLTMYEEGIQAFSAALELCCLEEKRQEILIEVLVQHCSRRDRGRLDIIKNISSATWASVAYDLTKVKLFSEAHTAFLQLMKVLPYQSNVRVNLRPLCDVDTVSKEVWILDLIKCLLRHGSDYNTMTSHSGDTYVHVVVRMTLVTGEIGLLQYVLESTLRQGELNELLDCLGNTALHLAAQYPKCSPFIRLDVMKLLAEAGVDETLKNSEGKTAVDYVSRSENHVLQCYKDYRAVCAKMLAEKADDIENSKEGDLEQETSADHTNVIEEQTEDGTNNNTKPLANSLITDEVPDDCSFENVNQLQGSGRIKEGDDDQLMLSPMQVGHGQTESQSQGRSEDFIVDSHLQVKPVPNKSEHDEEIHHVDDNALKQSQKRSWPPDYQSCTSDESKSKVKAGVEFVHDGDTTVQPVEQEQTDIDDEENVSENLGINDDDLMPEVKPHIITRHPAGSIEEQLKKNVIGMDDEDHVSQNHARNEDGMSEVQTQPFKQHSVETDQCSEMLSGDEYAMWTEHTITKSTKMNDPNGDKDCDFFPHVQSLFSSDTLIENKNFENSENGPMTTGLETEDNFDRHSYSPAPELHQMRMTMKNKSDDNDQKINKIDVISNLKQDGVPKTKFSVSFSGELFENEVLTWEVGPVLLEDIVIKKFDKEGCEQTHDRKSQQAILPKTYKVCDMEANLMPNTPNSENYDETHMAREVCTQTTTTHDRLHQIEHVKNKLERSKDSQSDNLKHIHKEVKELFNEGKSWLVDLRQKKKGFEILGRCLQKACLLSTDGYANDSITLICQHLDDTVDQDFCICLVHIPENYLNRILYLLLDDKKWTCALSIIKSHRKRHDSKTTLVETVNGLRLESVILDSKFRKSTKRLEHLIEDLLKIGVSLPEEGKGCIQACIRSGHYGIIPLLLSRGAHPKHVTLSIGDTPIHASTLIALETGNIEILEILLKKYKEDPRKNSHCDPCETNNNGDGLLHIVLRRPDGTMSRKVIDILLHHVPNIQMTVKRNSKGQFPSDLIKDKRDARRQMLNHVLSPGNASKGQKNKSRKASCSRQRKAVSLCGISTVVGVEFCEDIDENCSKSVLESSTIHMTNVDKNKETFTNETKNEDQACKDNLTGESDDSVVDQKETSAPGKHCATLKGFISDVCDTPMSSVPVVPNDTSHSRVSEREEESPIRKSESSSSKGHSSNQQHYLHLQPSISESENSIKEKSLRYKNGEGGENEGGAGERRGKRKEGGGKGGEEEEGIREGGRGGERGRREEGGGKEEDEKGGGGEERIEEAEGREEKERGEEGGGGEEEEIGKGGGGEEEGRGREKGKAERGVGQGRGEGGIGEVGNWEYEPVVYVQENDENTNVLMNSKEKQHNYNCGSHDDDSDRTNVPEDNASAAAPIEMYGSNGSRHNMEPNDGCDTENHTNDLMVGQEIKKEDYSATTKIEWIKGTDAKDKTKLDKISIGERVIETDEANVVVQIGQSKAIPHDEEAISDDSKQDEDSSETEEINWDKLTESCKDQISSMLEDLPWEVEFTAAFKKTMTSNLQPTTKNRILNTIYNLAKGDWHPSIKKKLVSHNKPKHVKLYEAKISKGSRLIWEKAIDFSPKLSAKTQIAKGKPINTETVNEVMYSEVIRIWYYVPSHDDIHMYVSKVCRALPKQPCIQRNPKSHCSSGKVFPSKFGLDCKEVAVFQPPVYKDKEQFHIRKFYDFSSDMLKHILEQETLDVDFPFRVTELEYAIINLRSEAPILLIGRSGTGKTTCCLYRMWHQFIGHLATQIEMEESDMIDLQEEEDIKHEKPHDENQQAENPQGVIPQDKKSEGENVRDGIRIETNQAVGASHTVIYSRNDEPVSCSADRLRQIFVTRNGILCSEAKKNFNQMKQGSSIARRYNLENDMPLPWSFSDIRDSQYPLFLTLEQLLNLADASVGPPYFYEREEDGSRKGNKRSLFEDNSSISGLIDGRLERDINVTYNSSKSTKKHQKRTYDITYDTFRDKIFPKLAGGDSKTRPDPSFLWAEFISIIKGSYEALLQKDGYLSREMYLEVGRKRAPNFDGDREEIYRLFKKYQEKSTEWKLFDECDLVHSIYSRLSHVHVRALNIHQLFVDEIQDFTQAEICLLLKLCVDPNQMFLTGDTAQTVMQGIQFRFCDLTTMFYKIRESMKTPNTHGAYLVNVPREVHQLTQSYRFHDGILALASSVLDIMAELFPKSFDRLQMDTGHLKGGPRPLLLESSNVSDLVQLIQSILGKESKSEDSSDIELGVHAAILVRNEMALKQLPLQLKQNITLTIYESKGLEFNNILLFNFFTYSDASKAWGVVSSLLTEFLTEMKTKENVSRTGMYQLDEDAMCSKGKPRNLKFEPERHKILSSELKLLYTALTRARVNVWIFDEDEEKRQPMFDYFKARKLVEVGADHFKTHQDRPRSTDQKPMEQNKDDWKDDSEQDRWIKKGHVFLQRQIYREAAKCFRKGGIKNLVNLARAHEAREMAQRSTDVKTKETKFIKAAGLYRLVDSGTDKYAEILAKECYMDARSFGEAAEYCKEIGKHREAALIYKNHVKNPVKSCECFIAAKRFDEAVDVLCKNKNYEKAIEVVMEYDKQLTFLEQKNGELYRKLKNHPPREQLEELRLRAAKVYCDRYKHDHEERNKKEMETYLRYLNFEEQCDLFVKWGLVDLAAERMKEKGKFDDAAMVYLTHGESSEKALTTARESRDNNLITRYLLFDTQMKVRNKASLNESQAEQQLNELLDMLKSDHTLLNHRLKGKAYLMKAKLQNGINDEERDSAVSTALNLFKQCKPPCLAGQVDCLSLMLEWNKLDCTRNITSVVKQMKSLHEMIELLEKDPTGQDEINLQDIYRYYGLEKTSNCYDLVLIEYDRHRLVHDMIGETNREIDVKIAISTFWKKKTSIWHGEVFSAIERQQKSLRPCSCQCREFPKEDCKSDYRLLTFERRKELLEIDLLLVELRVYHVHIFKNSSQQVVEPCRIFFHHLLPRNFSICFQQEQWYQLVEYLRKIDAIVKQTLDKEMEQEYEDMKRIERKWSTGQFMKQHFLKKYLQLNRDVRKNMERFVDDLYREHLFKTDKNDKEARKRMHPLGCLTDREKIECLAARFIQSYDMIAENMDPKGALATFTSFLKLLRGFDGVVLPDRNFLVMWIEYFLVVGCYLIGKADHTINFVLPASYINVTRYIDSSFATSKSKNSTLESIRATRKKQLKVNWIQNKIEVIASFLCEAGHKTVLMREVFRSADVEVAERVLLLSLTCLCNMENLLPTTLESQILMEIRSIQLPKNAPDRYAQTVTALKEATGQLEIGNAYNRLISERVDDLYLCNLSWGNVASRPVTDLNGILPLEFYNETTMAILQRSNETCTSEKWSYVEHTVASSTDHSPEENVSSRRVDSADTEKPMESMYPPIEKGASGGFCDGKYDETTCLKSHTPGDFDDKKHEDATECLSRATQSQASDTVDTETNNIGNNGTMDKTREKNNTIDWFCHGSSGMDM